MSLVCYGAYKYWGDHKKTNLNDLQISKSQYKRIAQKIMFFVHLFAGLIAAYIAWNRNRKNGIVMQIIVTVIAFLFGFLYLIYLVGFVMLDDELFKTTYLVSNDGNLDELAKSVAKEERTEE
jgi:hypothetical protein